MNDREKIARAICEAQGRDPDGFDKSFYCDANNRPLPCWQGYNEEADAVLTALGLGEGGENVVVPRGFGACPFGQRNDPRQRGLKPTDPCPVCGGLGTDDAEDKCVAYAATRRAMLSDRPQAGEAGE